MFKVEGFTGAQADELGPAQLAAIEAAEAAAREARVELIAVSLNALVGLGKVEFRYGANDQIEFVSGTAEWPADFPRG